MPNESDVSEAELHDIASELGLPLSDDTAAAFVDPVRDIVDSMDPVTRAPGPAQSVPAVDIVERDDPYNAFVTNCRLSRGSASGRLDGRTVALKDNIAVAGIPLTAGSGMLEEYVPARTAPVAERLLDAGATIVGKTNMDEFAFGPTGETSYYGPTKNPRSPEHTPGGSSSGSGAAVAAGDADLALGTDTGGSVRIPASYCGVHGLKPTQGRIPTDGIVELAGSLDTVGVLGTDIDDVADGLAVLADDWTVPDDLDAADPGSLTVGVPDSLFTDPVRESVANHVAGAVDDVVAAGATETAIGLPDTTISSAVWRAVTMSELYRYFTGDALPYRMPNGTKPAFNAAFRGATAADIDRLSDPLKQYLLIGGYLVTRDNGRRYGHALDVSERLTRRVEDAFEDVDVLVSPATPTTAFEFGAFSRDSSPPINNNTHLFNITGHPAISVPCGTVDGLPIGLQIVGEYGADAAVLRAAKTVTETVEVA